MCIYRYTILLIFCPSIVYSCHQQLNQSNGTVLFVSYENNVDCLWVFNATFIATEAPFRSLLLTFRQFDTEFDRDELFIGETIADVSKYNSKLFRFSGSKLPDPCLISLRTSPHIRTIWMQFTSDQMNTGSGFIIDYVFLVNQCKLCPISFSSSHQSASTT